MTYSNVSVLTVLRFTQRKIRKISNFTRCVLRDKVSTYPVTENALRDVIKAHLDRPFCEKR